MRKSSSAAGQAVVAGQDAVDVVEDRLGPARVEFVVDDLARRSVAADLADGVPAVVGHQPPAQGAQGALAGARHLGEAGREAVDLAPVQVPAVGQQQPPPVEQAAVEQRGHGRGVGSALATASVLTWIDSFSPSRSFQKYGAKVMARTQ